jgi:hypothetical protein
MVMSEVLPSLRAGQAYQAHVSVVPLVDRDGTPKPGWEAPRRVRWSAGPSFDVVERDRGASGDGVDTFDAGFDYWGPMVVQAQMLFDDGAVACLYTYAGLPDYPARVAGSGT